MKLSVGSAKEFCTFATCSLLVLLSTCLENTHDVFKWSMMKGDVLQNRIRLLLNCSYFVFFFPAGIGLLLCNLDFNIFFGRIWTVFMNRLIKLTPLKILLLVAFIRKVELKGGAWFPFYFSGKKVVLSILWCSSWLNQNQSPATLLLRNAYWNFWRELLRTINASVFRSGRVLWFLLSRCSSEAG